MFVGRKKELQVLETVFAERGIDLVVLYGRYGVGKTRLMKEFVKDRAQVYYLGREYSEREQMSHLYRVMEEAKENSQKGRCCLFIDEFDVIQRGYKGFFVEFLQYLETIPKENGLMVVFASSSVQWVENDMVREMGDLAARIVSFIKIKEFTFLEMVNYFPDLATEQCIAISGILGGVPGYLKYWDTKASVRQNIEKLLLDEDGPLHNEVYRFLKMSLREMSVYNTILTVLAEDQYKLNYLYNRTGFSRAKISVYIKNLIGLDVAQKIFSFETPKRENIQKGLYGITDSLLYFWYKFVFPHLSELEWMESEAFYRKYIEEHFDEFMSVSFIRVCREYLELMNQFDRLPFSYETIGSLYGKEGFIPLIAAGKDGQILVGTCKWSNLPMGTSELEELLKYMVQTGKEADYYYLFSKGGFTSELSTMGAGMENINLIDMDHL